LLPWVCGETGNSGTVTAEQKANLRTIHMATKSRPKKSFRNFQKRKYGTAPTIIGQHESRRKLAIVPIQDRIFVSNAEQPGSEDYHLADGPNDGSLSLSDFVFEIGEVLVFRGTDGLLFDLLKVTENVSTRVLDHSPNCGEIFLLKPREMKRTFSMP